LAIFAISILLILSLRERSLSRENIFPHPLEPSRSKRHLPYLSTIARTPDHGPEKPPIRRVFALTFTRKARPKNNFRASNRERRRSHARFGPQDFRFLYRPSVPRETTMPQINLHTTPDFDEDLIAVMMAMRVFNKSAAIRFAVRELADAYRKIEERRTLSAPQAPPEAPPRTG
jgi:hypothetical protein